MMGVPDKYLDDVSRCTDIIFTRAELQSFFILLCSAGTETTRTATSWGLELLRRFPEQRAI